MIGFYGRNSVLSGWDRDWLVWDGMVSRNIGTEAANISWQCSPVLYPLGGTLIPVTRVAFCLFCSSFSSCLLIYFCPSLFAPHERRCNEQ